MSEDFPRERLSLCMIVRNEAEKLGRCLISAAPWVGEMIVVDTGSTDETVAIAESFGAKVVHFEWCDDFAAARNVGLDHATKHWVLILDADEELVVESPEMFAALLLKTEPARFHLRIQNRQDSGSHTWAPVLRLFTRVHPGARFRSRIHEHLPVIPGVSFEQGIPDGIWLRHDGYTHKVTAARNKVARNVALSRLQVMDAPNDPHAWWCLATSLPSEECAEAVECFEKALGLIERDQGPLLASIYILGATALRNAGRSERALEYLNQGLEDFPLHPDILLQRGDYFLSAGLFEQAEKDFYEVRSAQGRLYQLRLIDPVVAMVASRVGRGHALARIGRLAEAEADWLAAIPLSSSATASPFIPLAQLKMGQQAWAEALDFLEREMARLPDGAEAKNLAVRCLLETGELEKAWGLLEALPDDSVVLTYKAQILLLQGRPGHAWEHLERVDPPAGDIWLKEWCQFCLGETQRALQMMRTAESEPAESPQAPLVRLALYVFANEPLPLSYQISAPALVEFVRGTRYLIRCQRFDELGLIIEKCQRLTGALRHLLCINLGKQLAFEGFADVALELLVDALKEDGSQVEALYWAGFAALQLNYMDDARTFWQECLALAPQHSLALQGMAMLAEAPGSLVS